MSKRILDRREFLKSAGVTTAVVVAAASGSMILAANRAWAMTLETLGQNEAETLLQMTRRLYPHEALGDIYYAEVVEALDQKALADTSLVELVKNGVTQLDQALGVPFVKLSPGTQLEAMRSIESTDFFQKMRGHTVVALYNNKNVWPTFGYQGSSWEEGGYLYRGFQDAGWTMEPDAEASPLAYTG